VKYNPDKSRILIVDGKSSVLSAAKAVFPDAVLADCEGAALQALKKQTFDVVITELNMERATSGLYVAQAALRHQTPVFTVASRGNRTGGASIVVKPYLGDFICPRGKNNPEMWRAIKDSLANQDVGCRNYFHSLELAKKSDIHVDVPTHEIAQFYGEPRSNLTRGAASQYQKFIVAEDVPFDAEPLSGRSRSVGGDGPVLRRVR